VLRRILDSPWLYFGAAALLVAAGLLSQVRVRLPERSTGSVDAISALRERDDLNVIFVLIDTLRADHLSGYGYSRKTSPFLDSLAQTGIRFSRVEAQSSWTKTSMASLWTGFWPSQTGVLRWDHSVPESAKMPAEQFQDAGFRTAGIYRNSWLTPKFGFAQGFDTYLRPVAAATPARFEKKNPSTHPLQGSDADVTLSAIEFLKANANERFFLYLHLMDVHQYAYDAKIPAFGTSYLDAYDTSIAWVDHNLGVLYAKLAEAGLLERTVIVVAADHGEAFGEHGFEGHARDVHAEVTETPLIISLPFALEEPVVVDDLVANVDIMPTILDLVGLPPLPGAAGRSLVPLILAAGSGEKAPLEPRPAYAELDRTWGATEQKPALVVSLRNDDWKYIHSVDGSVPEQLYDKREDPGEKTNVAAEQSVPLAALVQQVSRYLALAPAPFGRADQVEVGEEELERLRALGYVIK
jgi:arylsulfatase A-like enzyme